MLKKTRLGVRLALEEQVNKDFDGQGFLRSSFGSSTRLASDNVLKLKQVSFTLFGKFHCVKGAACQSLFSY